MRLVATFLLGELEQTGTDVQTHRPDARIALPLDMCFQGLLIFSSAYHALTANIGRKNGDP
jgi:hypothetical protein